MTSEEFVKTKYPKSFVKYINEKKIWICISEEGGAGTKLSDGNSESNAWVKAKDILLNIEENKHNNIKCKVGMHSYKIIGIQSVRDVIGDSFYTEIKRVVKQCTKCGDIKYEGGEIVTNAHLDDSLNWTPNLLLKEEKKKENKLLKLLKLKIPNMKELLWKFVIKNYIKYSKRKYNISDNSEIIFRQNKENYNVWTINDNGSYKKLDEI